MQQVAPLRLNAGLRVGVIDDTRSYTELLEGILSDNGISVKATGEPADCVEWVKNSAVDLIVADLRMDENGLDLVERLMKVGYVEMMIISSYTPTQEEKDRANRLGVSIYDKTALDDFIDHIKKLARSFDPRDRELRKLRWRVQALEAQNREWVEDLVSKLKQTPSFETAIISSADGSFSVGDLIRDIETLQPRGIEYIRLWRRTMDAILRLRKQHD